MGQKDDSLVALQNGCICCTLKMDLVEQLDELTRDGRFDYIVIEASGICEPAPIAQTICSIPSLGYGNGGPVARMDCIATVVDALRMQSEFNCGDALPLRNFDEDDIENLLIQQIEFCNIVILNKASEVSRADLGRIRQIIRNLQPKAEIIECNFCDFDLEKILDTGMFDFDQVATSAAWINEIEGDGHHTHELHDEEEGEAEEYGISTFVYFRRDPFDINRFDNYVAKHWPLWFATMPADELADMMRQDPNLARDWDPQYGDRMIKLVFIGQHMDKEAIAAELDSCIRPLIR